MKVFTGHFTQVGLAATLRILDDGTRVVDAESVSEIFSRLDDILWGKLGYNLSEKLRDVQDFIEWADNEPMVNNSLWLVDEDGE